MLSMKKLTCALFSQFNIFIECILYTRHYAPYMSYSRLLRQRYMKYPKLLSFYTEKSGVKSRSAHSRCQVQCTEQWSSYIFSATLSLLKLFCVCHYYHHFIGVIHEIQRSVRIHYSQPERPNLSWKSPRVVPDIGGIFNICNTIFSRKGNRMF